MVSWMVKTEKNVFHTNDLFYKWYIGIDWLWVITAISEFYFSYAIGGYNREGELVSLYLDIFNDGDFMVKCLARVPLLE
jgi:hypothetical protein